MAVADHLTAAVVVDGGNVGPQKAGQRNNEELMRAVVRRVANTKSHGIIVFDVKHGTT